MLMFELFRLIQGDYLVKSVKYEANGWSIYRNNHV